MKPARLAQLLTKAAIKNITLKMGVKVTASPPSTKNWLILNGTIEHTNLTATQFYVATKDTVVLPLYLAIAAAETTGVYPIFNNDEGLQGLQWQPTILTEDMTVNLSSASGKSAWFQVLEW